MNTHLQHFMEKNEQLLSAAVRREDSFIILAAIKKEVREISRASFHLQRMLIIMLDHIGFQPLLNIFVIECLIGEIDRQLH